MYIYLVRHGQSTGNDKKLFFGASDHPLTDLGREQARDARDKLRDVTFTRCLSSDLSRAWETARICLEGRDVTAEPTSDLREQDMGGLEDLTWEQAHERYGDLPMQLLHDWFGIAPPDGGESVQTMLVRVSRCVDEVIARGEDTLLVAHNGSLSLLLWYLKLAGEHDIMRPGRIFEHGTYSALRIDENGAVLEKFNA